MHNDQLVYNVVIWAFFEISLWKEKVALSSVIYQWVGGALHQFFGSQAQHVKTVGPNQI